MLKFVRVIALLFLPVVFIFWLVACALLMVEGYSWLVGTVWLVCTLVLGLIIAALERMSHDKEV